jgi:hypothetical protein
MSIKHHESVIGIVMNRKGSISYLILCGYLRGTSPDTLWWQKNACTGEDDRLCRLCLLRVKLLLHFGKGITVFLASAIVLQQR